jgi:hypothetical protein
MARAYNIHVVLYRHWDTTELVAAFTVKHELDRWMSTCPARERQNYEVITLRDGISGIRDF